MADDADLAADIQERHNVISLHNRYKGLRPLGWCRNCEEKLPKTLVFCDKYCGDDYARLQINAVNAD